MNDTFITFTSTWTGLQYTVGAQSIARAQSIAPSHIGDVICQKNENL